MCAETACSRVRVSCVGSSFIVWAWGDVCARLFGVDDGVVGWYVPPLSPPLMTARLFLSLVYDPITPPSSLDQAKEWLVSDYNNLLSEDQEDQWCSYNTLVFGEKTLVKFPQFITFQQEEAIVPPNATGVQVRVSADSMCSAERVQIQGAPLPSSVLTIEWRNLTDIVTLCCTSHWQVQVFENSGGCCCCCSWYASCVMLLPVCVCVRRNVLATRCAMLT